MSYAWIIDKDHLAEPTDAPGTNLNAVGVIGPRTAPKAMSAQLSAGKRGKNVYTFRMYDDDGELYYTGRLMINDTERETLRDGVTPTVSERACYAPLADYGMPNAGAVSITYPRHPDMDCG